MWFYVLGFEAQKWSYTLNEFISMMNMMYCFEIQIISIVDFILIDCT